MVLEARGRVSAGELQQTIRQVVTSVDPELPVARTVSFQAALAASLAETRTVGYLTGTFGALALILAALGLYGLVSFGVSQRIRELGVRKALGAAPATLVRMVMLRGAALGAVGVATGLALSWIMGRALAGLLFGVAPLDPATLSVTALLLLAVVLLAAWVPARRASRVDAAVSLRE
jgi:putative ABC transport system permease protein